MRWAGSFLCFSVGLMACGGRAPADAAGDGGSNVATPDGGTDGGTTADCSGVMPPAPGTAIAFDVPAVNGETCAAAGVDGDGNIVADAESSSATKWYVFYPNGVKAGGSFL